MSLLNNDNSSNPAFKEDTFKKFGQIANGQTMTVEGTLNKIALLTLLVFCSALYSWNSFFEAIEPSATYPMMTLGAIGGFIAALVIIFKPNLAPFVAPVYAILEGLFIGALSAMMEFIYPGIVLQASLITFGILFTVLGLYRTGVLKATPKFKKMVIIGTAGVALVYMASWILSFFGTQIPYIHEGGQIGIIFSLVVIALAAMNFVLDFDFIEKNANYGAPKYMEWYAAFGLMVTLIWLYVEVLRLLAKINSRD